MGPRLDAFNGWLAGRGIQRPFRIGVGLNAGPLMSGNVGTERRLEYTAIGDTINTAARVESLTKEYGVPLLLTQSVVDLLHERHDDLRFVEEVVPRGRTSTVRLWTIGVSATVDALSRPAGDDLEARTSLHLSLWWKAAAALLVFYLVVVSQMATSTVARSYVTRGMGVVLMLVFLVFVALD